MRLFLVEYFIDTPRYYFVMANSDYHEEFKKLHEKDWIFARAFGCRGTRGDASEAAGKELVNGQRVDVRQTRNQIVHESASDLEVSPKVLEHQREEATQSLTCPHL